MLFGHRFDRVAGEIVAQGIGSGEGGQVLPSPGVAAQHPAEHLVRLTVRQQDG